MTTFTLADLEARIAERAKASPDESWTAKLLAAGPERCAKKLGEEAVRLKRTRRTALACSGVLALDAFWPLPGMYPRFLDWEPFLRFHAEYGWDVPTTLLPAGRGIRQR